MQLDQKWQYHSKVSSSNPWLGVVIVGFVLLVIFGRQQILQQLAVAFSQSSQSPSQAKQPPLSKSYHFVLLGDTGAATPAQFAVASAAAQQCHQLGGCQAAFIAGDIIYEHGVKTVNDEQFQTKFEEPYVGLELPFYIAYGNHDYLGCTECYLDYSAHSAKWRMPARYYQQSFGSAVEFFVIDTEKFDTKQQQWLQVALSQSQASHKVVVGHRPLVTFESTKLGENWQGKQELQELLCQSVDLYVAGHSHVLEDAGALPGCKVRQIVTGGGGAYPRTVAEQNSDVFSAAKNGLVILSIVEQEPGKTALKYHFVDDQNQVLFSSNN